MHTGIVVLIRSEANAEGEKREMDCWMLTTRRYLLSFPACSGKCSCLQHMKEFLGGKQQELP